MKSLNKTNSAPTGEQSSLYAEHQGARAPRSSSGWVRPTRLFSLLGPAFIASVAYMDPGNFATNIQGGARYGYMLIWVVVASNLIAMLVQLLSAKLGLATGLNLAEVCRDQFLPAVVWGMWVIGELVAIATDLAEFLGAAVGFQLLLGIPPLVGGALTVVVTFVILGLERRGVRHLTAAITTLVGVIAVCYIIELILGRPDWAAVGAALVKPRLEGQDSLLLATGILGATVMPHVIFLHSALTQRQASADHSPQTLRHMFRVQVIDVTTALSIAGFVNAAMLILAASTFHQSGLQEIATLEEAHRTLTPLLGQLSSTVFALSLLASGLSSTTVGTLAGQVIMQGFLHRSIPVWVRRTVTLFPSLVVLAIGIDPTKVLVISQVVLSFGIPFALVPLVLFTRRRDLMGSLANWPLITLLAGLAAVLIIGLNVMLLAQLAMGG